MKTGFILVALVAALAGLGFALSFSPVEMNIANRLSPPSAQHWLGTDHVGRDLLALTFAGLYHAVVLALLATLSGAAGGVALGMTAAFTQNSVLDAALSRLFDIVFIFPTLLLAVVLSSALSASLVTTFLTLTLFTLPVFFRLSRALALGLLTRPFITAARAVGRSRFGIFMDHILPNCAGALAVQFCLHVGLVLLVESGLSYLGLGLPPSLPSLGRQLNDAQTYLMIAPRLVLVPGFSLALCVFGLNEMGDRWRARYDPRQDQVYF